MKKIITFSLILLISAPLIAMEKLRYDAQPINDKHLVAQASAGIPSFDKVYTLLKEGANPNAFDATGKSALQLAKERRHIAVVDALRKAGATE